MSTRRAELMLVVATLVWGATFAITKVLVEAGVDPVAVVAWRFAIASVGFLLLFGRHVTRHATRPALVHGAILGVFLYAGFGLQAVGLVETTSSRSGFITALYVIFTPFLQVLVTRRAPGRRVVAGIALVLVGLWALTAPGGRLSGLVDPWREGGFNGGDLLTLASAFFFAIYIVLLDRYADDAPTLTAAQLTTVAVIAIAQVFLVERPAASLAIPAEIGAWSGILYLALLSSVLATYLQTRYQRQTTPSRAAVIFTLESVFAAIIGAVALGESLTPLALAGGALILVGLVVAETAPARRDEG